MAAAWRRTSSAPPTGSASPPSAASPSPRTAAMRRWRSSAATTVPDEGPVQRPFCPQEHVSVSVKDAALVDVIAVFRQVSGFPIVGLEKETRAVSIEVLDVTW